MYNDPSNRPTWYRQLQHLADAVGGTQYMMRLDPEELIATAQASSGLSDFGPDAWRDHYEIAIRSISEEANLNFVGTITARTEILRSLRNRLYMQELIRQHPQILEEPIEQPVFIGGFGRTGTSITHELLALNPLLRAPMTWEAHQIGDETLGGHSREQRIAQTNAEQLIYNEIAPEYQTMHENDAEHPSECAMIHWSEFISHNWSGPYAAPSYEIYAMQQDRASVYAFQKRYLQVLQWQRRQSVHTDAPPPRWVLKSPGHEAHLVALFSVFPDAQFLHTHRDMSKVIGSLCSLMATLRWMKSDQVNTDVFAYIGPGVAAGFRHIIALRESGDLPLNQIHDVYFQDLINNPNETLAQVYRLIGLDYSEKEHSAIEAYLKNKPMGKHGTHEYTLEQFGYDKNQLNTAFADYMAYFKVPFEH
jgi:hypothetical protein